MSNQAMCPHCGALFSYPQCAAAEIPGLIPAHTVIVRAAADMSAAALQAGAAEEERACPGSLQGPRNPESDRRPLWKDGGSS